MTWKMCGRSPEFQDVSFRYEEHLSRVLRHINLKVPAGSYVALVGTSGAGKDNPLQPDTKIL